MKKGLGLHVSKYFTTPPRVVLLRLRQGRADQGVRGQDRPPGRDARRHHHRPQEAGGRAQGDQRPPRGRRTVERDRHDRPEERLHQGDGLVGRLRQVEVQPRRPGPPPARLDVQGDGADDRAAQGRGPAPDDVRLEAAEVQRPAVGPDRRPDLRARLPRLDQPRAGDAVLGQHGLRAARARPRAARDQADRLRHGHQDAPRRLPGGGARRPDARRLPAGDGRRLRDDRLRRLSQPADRDHQDHLPRRQVGAPAALHASSAPRRSRTASPPRRRGSSRRTSSGAPARPRTSAARRAARPAPPTRSTTRGSSASRRG